MLTIDHRIQANAERVLRDTVEQWRAKGGTAIVLDPRTGAVLAMAVAPGFDANRFGTASPDGARNRAVTDVYEPGSTFKVVTVAAALSEKLVAPTTPFVAAVVDPGRRPDHPRARAAPDGAMTVARDPRAARRTSAPITLAQLLGRERLESLDRPVRLRPADGHRLPRASRRACCPALVRLDDRQRADRPGHRRHADPDGGRLRRDRERRRSCAEPHLVQRVGRPAHRSAAGRRVLSRPCRRS